MGGNDDSSDSEDLEEEGGEGDSSSRMEIDLDVVGRRSMDLGMAVDQPEVARQFEDFQRPLPMGPNQG